MKTKPDALAILGSLVHFKNHGSIFNPHMVLEIDLEKGNGQADAKVIRDELRSLRPPFLSDELLTVFADLDEYIQQSAEVCDPGWANSALEDCEAEVRQAIADNRRIVAAEAITYPMFSKRTMRFA